MTDQERNDELSESLTAVEQVLLLVAARLRAQAWMLLLGGAMLTGLQVGVLWAQITIGRTQAASVRVQQDTLKQLVAVRTTAEITAKQVDLQPRIRIMPMPSKLITVPDVVIEASGKVKQPTGHKAKAASSSLPAASVTPQTLPPAPASEPAQPTFYVEGVLAE